MKRFTFGGSEEVFNVHDRLSLLFVGRDFGSLYKGAPGSVLEIWNSDLNRIVIPFGVTEIVTPRVLPIVYGSRI